MGAVSCDPRPRTICIRISDHLDEYVELPPQRALKPAPALKTVGPMSWAQLCAVEDWPPYEVQALDHFKRPILIEYRPTGVHVISNGRPVPLYIEHTCRRSPYVPELDVEHDPEEEARKALEEFDKLWPYELSKAHPPGFQVLSVPKDQATTVTKCKECDEEVVWITSKRRKLHALDVRSALTDSRGKCTMLRHQDVCRQRHNKR